MPFFKITQIRSSIGLPSKTRGALLALGLRRRQQTVFHQVNGDIAGQIMRVKELVAVSEVEEALSKQEMAALRKPDPGYYVETVASQVREQAAKAAPGAGHVIGLGRRGGRHVGLLD